MSGTFSLKFQSEDLSSVFERQREEISEMLTRCHTEATAEVNFTIPDLAVYDQALLLNEDTK